MYLNLVFHDLVENKDQLNNKYTVTYTYYKSLIDELDKLILLGQVNFLDYRIYFDDGKKSFIDYIEPTITKPQRFNLAIISQLIGKTGYFDSNDLLRFQSKGINISSHGVSHAALAIYEDDKLIINNNSGEYTNAPYGKGKSLTIQEVLFQTRQSKMALENILGKDSITEFVFPFGLYNSMIVENIIVSKDYKILSTCDQSLDRGQVLRPRFLVDNQRSISQTIKEILSL
jgi:Polysaccharide deacetylase